MAVTTGCLIEWPDGEKAPTHYTLARLRKAPSRKQLVRITKERWRTERVYEDLKGELGLDHYEGRSFRGWHHHVTVVLCCYAFVTSERLRHFPPRAEGRVLATRSTARHERHFEDSFITARLAIARVLVRWFLGARAVIMPTRLHAQPSDSGSSVRSRRFTVRMTLPFTGGRRTCSCVSGGAAFGDATTGATGPPLTYQLELPESSATADGRRSITKRLVAASVGGKNLGTLNG